MGLLTTIVASTSVGSFVALLIILGLIFLNYWATSRIITQAGYSPLWILLPIAPVVLTIIAYIILWNDLHTIVFGGTLGYGGINTAGLVWHLDELAIFLNWLFYLVFAFSRWPVSGAHHSANGDVPRSPENLRANPGAASVPPTPAAVLPTPRPALPTAAGPGTAPGVPSAPAQKAPTGQFCAWCGESLPGNRALFHDCGPKDRPENFCKNCGATMPPGTSECSSCGTARIE